MPIFFIKTQIYVIVGIVFTYLVLILVYGGIVAIVLTSESTDSGFES